MNQSDSDVLFVSLELSKTLNATLWGSMIRTVLDRAADTPRTGFASAHQLQQSAKTSIGTEIEIALRNTLKLSTGLLDLAFPMLEPSGAVRVIDVDVKWSLGNDRKDQCGTSWMIPSEALGKIVILISGWDSVSGSKFTVGVYRVPTAAMNYRGLSAENKDGKRSLLKETRDTQVNWLFDREPMPDNVLVCMSETDRTTVLAQPAGPLRIAEALKILHGKPVSLASLAVLDAPNVEGRLEEVRSLLGQAGHTVTSLLSRGQTTWRSLCTISTCPCQETLLPETKQLA